MSGQPLLPLKQALAEMQAAKEPFALRFVKLNEGKQQGGEIVELPSVLLSGRNEGKETASGVERKGSPVAEASSEHSQPGKITRDPNHSDNMTRNLVSTINGRYAKVHIYLILSYNGKKVII
ncbi:hypothetical protein [Hymenobacter sp. BT491]|uniref:hypothetical protein n=1 Tax=Hymenobacter sp. BT491 TaxID=2766779 RepID=UPI00165367AE|nr:hypothetical protein [Hymenobacter sp. BT491]MBC6988566.1 hypothetical protein [Hymenobacter sp. BT491]